jgi:hypothetical protein
LVCTIVLTQLDEIWNLIFVLNGRKPEFLKMKGWSRMVKIHQGGRDEGWSRLVGGVLE